MTLLVETQSLGNANLAKPLQTYCWTGGLRNLVKGLGSFYFLHPFLCAWVYRYSADLYTALTKIVIADWSNLSLTGWKISIDLQRNLPWRQCQMVPPIRQNGSKILYLTEYKLDHNLIAWVQAEMFRRASPLPTREFHCLQSESAPLTMSSLERGWAITPAPKYAWYTKIVTAM